MVGKNDVLGREHMSSAVSVLTNTPKISDTLRQTFEMKQYDESGAVQLFGLFSMLITESIPKLTTSFAVSNFRNT